MGRAEQRLKTLPCSALDRCQQLVQKHVYEHWGGRVRVSVLPAVQSREVACRVLLSSKRASNCTCY